MIEELLAKHYQRTNAPLRDLLLSKLPQKERVVIGIEGASGSGKTTLGRELLKKLTPERHIALL